MPDRAEHDERVRAAGHAAARPRGVRHRVADDRGQRDRRQLPHWTPADRRVRGRHVRVRGRVQRRVLPGAARVPARRLHRAGRPLRVPGARDAQLPADRSPGRRRGRRVVRARPPVRAREPVVAGVARPRRRRRVRPSQAPAPGGRAPPRLRRARRRGRPALPAARQPPRRVPAVPRAVPAPRAPAALRAAGVGRVRRRAGGRLGRARAQLALRRRRAGRLPRGRQLRVRGHGPPRVHRRALVHRHHGRRRRGRRVQPGPRPVPQPVRLAAVELRAAVRDDGVRRVQQRGPGPRLAGRQHARRTRRPGVQLRRRLRRHQVLSVRTVLPGLVGFRSVCRRRCVEHCLRRLDVFRFQ